MSDEIQLEEKKRLFQLVHEAVCNKNCNMCEYAGALYCTQLKMTDYLFDNGVEIKERNIKC